MAIVTPALLQALFTGFKKNFEDAKGEAPAQYTKIATVIKSTTKSNTYGWLGKFPSLRKWVGDRVIESMKAHGYQIVNEDFEATVAVDRNDIEDDELGIYAPLFQEMGLAAGSTQTSSALVCWVLASPRLAMTASISSTPITLSIPRPMAPVPLF